MKYKTKAAALEALANGPIKAADCAARVLKARIYVTGAGQPGCLFDSGPNYHATKADAVADLLFIADTGEGVPRGMRAALMRGEYVRHEGWVYELSTDTLGGVL